MAQEVRTADKLPEGAEAMPQEWQDEYERRNRAVMEKILDKAAEDEAWRQKMKDDPSGALKELGVMEELELLDPESGALASSREEAEGQRLYQSHWYRYCYYYTSYHGRWWHWTYWR